jgi:hypothetical protein
MPVSLAAHLPSVSLDGTKLVWNGALKITLVSVDTRASASDQIPRRTPLSMHVQQRKRFRCPKPSVSHPAAQASVVSSVVGLKKVRGGNLKRSKLVFLRNPANSKGIAGGKT